MVYESYPWKQELLRQKKSIIKYNTHEEYLKPNDLAYTMVERGIFYSAFIIRKLIDCNGKMSDAADNYTFRVQAIKPLKEINSIGRWPDSDTHEWEKEVILTVEDEIDDNMFLSPNALPFEMEGVLSEN